MSLTDTGFESLYIQEYERLRGYIRKRLPESDRNMADDMAGTVFLRAWERRDHYRPIPGVKPKAWLYCIASNLLVDRYRRAGRLDFVRLGAWDPFGEDAGSDEHLDRLDAQAAVSAALATYQTGNRGYSANKQLAVIRERFFVGGTDRDIGERLGLPTMVVKQVRRRALANLRKTLEVA